MNSKAQWKEDLKSPWLRGIIGTVLFALIINIIMITLTVYYPHSLVAKDYYSKGKRYFHSLDQENKAEHLGYKLQLVLPNKLKANIEENIQLQVFNQDGKPLNIANATLFVYRVNDVTRDFQLTLSKTYEGKFESNVKFSLPGTWDLIGQITVSGEKLDVAKRIFVDK